jgi:hypothetical protein
MGECSREDSNLHGLPHTVLSRTRLPVPPREQGRRETIEETRDVKEKHNHGGKAELRRQKEEGGALILVLMHCG